jgi:hypothetical protein
LETTPTLQTQFEFTLPRGYLDVSGGLQRQGVMRLATARDEIECLQDPRLRENEGYLPVLLLQRVITRLGTLPAVTSQVVENLFASDLAYLEDLYLRLNSHEVIQVGAVCPNCSAHFRLQVAPLGMPADDGAE